MNDETKIHIAHDNGSHDVTTLCGVSVVFHIQAVDFKEEVLSKVTCIECLREAKELGNAALARLVEVEKQEPIHLSDGAGGSMSPTMCEMSNFMSAQRGSIDEATCAKCLRAMKTQTEKTISEVDARLETINP